MKDFIQKNKKIFILLNYFYIIFMVFLLIFVKNKIHFIFSATTYSFLNFFIGEDLVYKNRKFNLIFLSITFLLVISYLFYYFKFLR